MMCRDHERRPSVDQLMQMTSVATAAKNRERAFSDKQMVRNGRKGRKEEGGENRSPERMFHMRRVQVLYLKNVTFCLYLCVVNPCVPPS